MILLDIYPARELPINGVTSSWLMEKMPLKNKQLSSKENLINNIKKSSAKVIAILGAGDIGMLVEDIKNELLIHNKLTV